MSDKKSRVRVAVVGCGGRGRGAYLRHLSTFEDVDVVAVCDPVKAARDAAGDEFGVSGRHATVDELLEGESLDAVFVATPAHLNGLSALPCLEQGVSTLVEKPPGMSAAETAALRDAADRTSAKAMVGWNRRFNPIVTRARAMIEERGPVVQILGEFHKSMAELEASGRFPEAVLDNMLLESPIHAIDLVRAIAGAEVAEVHGFVRRAVSRYKDVHAALVVFENGCIAQIMANYTTDARLERYEIHGHGISAYLEGVAQGVVVCNGERHDLGDRGSGGTLEEIRFFLDCVKEDRPVSLPAANLDEAVKTMELADAILAGLRP